ncbi:hypothetical protein ASV01_16850 [Enterobacter kobei]|nr:hypothetical protein ASV01_16850 [Enterobacter kobei]OOV74846.1 hypothetical protein B1742_10490 [Enterobacter kobei]
MGIKHFATNAKGVFRYRGVQVAGRILAQNVMLRTAIRFYASVLIIMYLPLPTFSLVEQGPNLLQTSIQA